MARKARDFELITLSPATRRKLDELVAIAHPGDSARANWGPRVYLEELIEIAIAERHADLPPASSRLMRAASGFASVIFETLYR